MAICTTCSREMKEAEGCTMNPIPTVDGELTPVLFGSEVDPIQKAYYADGSPRRCDDCGAMPANYHHPGCDIEECPRCSGQLLSCDCLIEQPETAETVVQ